MAESGEPPISDTPIPARKKDHIPVAGVVLIILIGVCWGFNWAAIKISVTEVSPWTFRAWCLIAGASVMMIMARSRVGRLRLRRRDIGPLILLGLLNVAGYQVFVAFGLSMMDAARAIVLGHTQPLWVVLLGALLLKEQLTPSRAIALVIGMSAMTMLIAPDAAAIGGAPWGAVLVVISAVLWSLGTVLFKRFDISLTAVELAAWQLTFGGVPVVICAVIFDPLPDLTQISPRAIVAMLYAGILAVGFGQWAWYRALQLLPASAAAIGSLLIPVVGMFASAWLLDETVTWLEITALVLVLISLTMVLIGPAGLDAWRRWRAG